MAQELQQYGVPVVTACRRLAVARSSVYYRPRPVAVPVWLAPMQALAQQHPAWGYRKVLHELRQAGHVINAKRFHRYWRGHGLGQPPLRSHRRFRRPSRPFEAVVPHRAGDVWTMDFIQDRMTTGRAFRILNVLDVYSRRALEPLVDVSLPGTAVAAHLAVLFRREGVPTVIRRDGGPEFRSQAVQRVLAQWRVKQEEIPPGQPFDNGHVESFHRTLRRECLSRELFADIVEARMTVRLWTLGYNEQRPHMALDYRTPAAVWKESIFQPQDPNIPRVQIAGADLGRPNTSSV